MGSNFNQYKCDIFEVDGDDIMQAANKEKSRTLCESCAWWPDKTNRIVKSPVKKVNKKDLQTAGEYKLRGTKRLLLKD